MGYENFKWQKDGRNACFCHGIIVVSKNTKSSCQIRRAAFLMAWLWLEVDTGFMKSFLILYAYNIRIDLKNIKIYIKSSKYFFDMLS